MKIKFNQLLSNDYNPRKLFKDAAMEELKTSIKQYGLIEPLVVRKIDNKYEVVAGMRRYYALKDLEFDEVECNIMELTNLQAKLTSLIENLQRENLTPIEEARAYAINLGIDFKLYKNFYTTFDKSKKGITEFANKIGKSPPTISNRLHLLFLPEDIQNAIHHGELNLQIAQEISKLREIKDDDSAQECMMEIYNDYLSEKDTISMGELKKRITNKIDYYNRKDKEQEGIIEERIKELKKKIKETNKSSAQILLKLSKVAINVINEESFNDIDFSEYELIKRESVLDDKENLDEEDRDIIVKEGEDILEFLQETEKKYANNKEYEDVSTKINELENKIDDIQLLFNRVKEKNIIECPFCYSGINLKAIKEKKLIHKEKLEELKLQRKQLTKY